MTRARGIASLFFAVSALLALAPSVLAATFEVTPICFDDENEFVWTVAIAVGEGESPDFTIDASQGADGQRISDRPVRAGNENMIVIGLAGQGPVTFTLDTGESVTVDGSDVSCYEAYPTQPTVEIDEPVYGDLPPTDTAEGTGRLTDAGIVFVLLGLGLLGAGVVLSRKPRA